MGARDGGLNSMWQPVRPSPRRWSGCRRPSFPLTVGVLLFGGAPQAAGPLRRRRLTPTPSDSEAAGRVPTRRRTPRRPPRRRRRAPAAQSPEPTTSRRPRSQATTPNDREGRAVRRPDDSESPSDKPSESASADTVCDGVPPARVVQSPPRWSRRQPATTRSSPSRSAATGSASDGVTPCGASSWASMPPRPAAPVLQCTSDADGDCSFIVPNTPLSRRGEPGQALLGAADQRTGAAATPTPPCAPADDARPERRRTASRPAGSSGARPDLPIAPRLHEGHRCRPQRGVRRHLAELVGTTRSSPVHAACTWPWSSTCPDSTVGDLADHEDCREHVRRRSRRHPVAGRLFSFSCRARPRVPPELPSADVGVDRRLGANAFKAVRLRHWPAERRRHELGPRDRQVAAAPTFDVLVVITDGNPTTTAARQGPGSSTGSARSRTASSRRTRSRPRGRGFWPSAWARRRQRRQRA